MATVPYCEIGDWWRIDSRMMFVWPALQSLLSFLSSVLPHCHAAIWGLTMCPEIKNEQKCVFDDYLLVKMFLAALCFVFTMVKEWYKHGTLIYTTKKIHVYIIRLWWYISKRKNTGNGYVMIRYGCLNVFNSLRDDLIVYRRAPADMKPK